MKSAHVTFPISNGQKHQRTEQETWVEDKGKSKQYKFHWGIQNSYVTEKGLKGSFIVC